MSHLPQAPARTSLHSRVIAAAFFVFMICRMVKFFLSFHFFSNQTANCYKLILKKYGWNWCSKAKLKGFSLVFSAGRFQRNQYFTASVAEVWKGREVGGGGEGGAGVARKRIGAREEGAPRVFLAPKSPCPFPFKRLLRRLNILWYLTKN